MIFLGCQGWLKKRERKVETEESRMFLKYIPYCFCLYDYEVADYAFEFCGCCMVKNIRIKIHIISPHWCHGNYTKHGYVLCPFALQVTEFSLLIFWIRSKGWGSWIWLIHSINKLRYSWSLLSELKIRTQMTIAELINLSFSFSLLLFVEPWGCFSFLL